MMPKRCGCASDSCSCHIVPGDGISMAGAGSEKNPYVVTATVSELDAGVAVEANNVEKVHLANRLDFRGSAVTVAPGGLGEAVITVTGGSSSGGSAPPGSMMMFGGVTAPSGWLLCDGTQYLISTYPDLAAAIGNRFGGDGTTNFKVPNMADTFPIGKSPTKAVASKGGAATKSIATSNLPPHNHTNSHTHSFGAEYADTTAGGGSYIRINDIANKTGGGGTDITVTTSSASASTGSTGSGAPLDVTPPYMALSFIIKT